MKAGRAVLVGLGLALGLVIAIGLGLAMAATTTAFDALRLHPPTSDGWLGFVGNIFAVVGAFAVGAWTSRLALGNALIVLRREREDDERARQASMRQVDAANLRAALTQLVNECRRWRTAEPQRGLSAVERLTKIDLYTVNHVLHFDALRPDLRDYLQWSQSEVAILSGGFLESVRVVREGIGGASLDSEKWWWTIEQMQVVACLLISEATHRGLTEVASDFRGNPSFEPLQSGARGREEAELLRTDRVAWPAGDEYAECSPARRDTQAAKG